VSPADGRHPGQKWRAELEHFMTQQPHDVAPGVARVRVAFVNVFLVGDDPDAGETGWCLLDAGVGPCAGTIRRVVHARFGPGARPGAIVLTHGHFDHVGAVRQLAAEWDVPVYAHPLELPYLDGRSPYPPPDPSVGGGAMAWMAPLYPRGPIDLGRRLHPLPDDGSVPGAIGWRWVHTPGHTPGHVSLFRDGDRALIAGDAVLTTRQESLFSVLRQAPGVYRPAAYYTSDWAEAGRSVRKLADLAPRILATGHGRTLRGDPMREALEELALHFEEMVPARGRYVEQPALSDGRGVVSVPPRTPPSRTTVAVGALLSAAAVIAWRRRASRRAAVAGAGETGAAEEARAESEKAEV
jgi:glyoxylase-like metal-dependent hydrolase (beta-lactamase superfamily II)